MTSSKYQIDEIYFQKSTWFEYIGSQKKKPHSHHEKNQYFLRFTRKAIENRKNQFYRFYRKSGKSAELLSIDNQKTFLHTIHITINLMT